MNSKTRVDGGKGWVDVCEGVVRREAFVSDAVYRHELAAIFEKQWIFLAHETEIPEPGNYVTRTLGNAPVILIRGTDHRIHGLLNSCRHRGAKLCRSDSGSVARFVCPYHGWSFERGGKLITTSFDQFWPKEISQEDWGLIPVPKLESYKGFVFGSWNADAQDLSQFLGDFRFYLDAFIGRTPSGVEVLGPPHRWRTKTNWKVGSLNFVGDGQHTPTTHRGPLTLDSVRSAKNGLAKRGGESVQIIVNGGHGITLSYLADGLAPEIYNTHSTELDHLYNETLTSKQRDVLRHLRAAVGTVFPNFSFIESQAEPGHKALVFRLWHPVSGTEMEVLSWVLAEREAASSYKQTLLKRGMHNFGAAGMFEQDDLLLWESATSASLSRIAQSAPYSFHTALPYLNSPLTDYEGPGRAYRPSTSEVVQLEFMRHWESLMPSFEEVIC
jgi:phenylpropionate dioxygenase-like ring-hydroxylating dioxygenase large terminal subunit